MLLLEPAQDSLHLGVAQPVSVVCRDTPHEMDEPLDAVPFGHSWAGCFGSKESEDMPVIDGTILLLHGNEFRDKGERQREVSFLSWDLTENVEETSVVGHIVGHYILREKDLKVAVLKGIREPRRVQAIISAEDLAELGADFRIQSCDWEASFEFEVGLKFGFQQQTFRSSKCFEVIWC
jgi:hypothetical protein